VRCWNVFTVQFERWEREAENHFDKSSQLADPCSPHPPNNHLVFAHCPQQQEASNDDDEDDDDDDEIADPMVELKEKCSVRVLEWLFTHTFFFFGLQFFCVRNPPPISVFNGSKDSSLTVPQNLTMLSLESLRCQRGCNGRDDGGIATTFYSVRKVPPQAKYLLQLMVARHSV
jgi:hypothetical protein